jgi:hypothetical protein
MKINYRVLNIDEAQHSIVVRYWTDKITEEMLASEYESNGKIRLSRHGWPTRCVTDYNLTFYENNIPTEEEVDFFIKKNAPVNWLKLREEVLDPQVKTDLISAKPLLNKDNSFEAMV